MDDVIIPRLYQDNINALFDKISKDLKEVHRMQKLGTINRVSTLYNEIKNVFLKTNNIQM